MAIAESMRKTREKRLSQDCHVFKIKIDSSSLKTNQAEALKMQFIEAKWIANEAIRIREHL
jgi:putative transposase